MKPERLLPFAVLALLCLLPLFESLATGKALGPFDHLAPMVGAAPTKPAQNWDILQADGALQFYPWRDLVFESWRQGRVPFWNPYQLGGTPLLANSQSGGLYPLHIVVGVLGVPTVAAMKLLAWLHLLIAGVGVWLLLRELGATREGRLIGAGSFAASAFMVAWIGLPSVITTCAWIPWVLLGVEKLASAPAFRRLGWLALPVALLLLAGHLQFAAYGLIAGVLLAVWRVVAIRKVGAAMLLVGGFAAGAMLAAPQVMAVLDYSTFSHRANKPSAEGYAAYVDASVKPFELPALVSLGFLGHPGPLHAEPQLPNYWPSLAKTGANPAESAITLGPFVLALLVYGFAARRFGGRAWAYVAIAVFSALLWSGSPLNAALYYGVPGWSSTGSPARSAVLFVLACGLLAGLAWPRETSAPRSLAIAGGTAVGLTVIAFALAMSGMGATVRPFLAERGVVLDTGTGQAALIPVLAFALAGVAVLWASQTGRLKGKDHWAIAGVLVLGGLGSMSGWVPTGHLPAKPAALEAVPPSDRAAFVNEAWELVVAAPATMPPNTASWFRVRDIAGYDSLLHRDTVEMLREINGQDPAPPANGNIMFVKPGADVARLRDAGVSMVFSPNQLPGLEGRRTELGWMTPIGGTVVEATCEVRDTFNTRAGAWGFKVIGPGTLTVRERNIPGWRATVDYKPASTGDGRWIEIEVPEGASEVSLSFVSPGYEAGLRLALVGFLLLAASLVAGRFGPRLSDPRPVDAP